MPFSGLCHPIYKLYDPIVNVTNVLIVIKGYLRGLDKPSYYPNKKSEKIKIFSMNINCVTQWQKGVLIVTSKNESFFDYFKI